MRISHWVAAAALIGTCFGQPEAVLTEREAARFLDQATWGPTQSAIGHLEITGFQNWLQEQFSLNTSDLPDQPILTSTGTTNTSIAPVDAAFFQNTLTEPDQLRQRVAFALSEIWVVSQQSGVTPAYAYPPYWRLFRDNAFGNYRAVIKAITLSPAMGRYLNMANNNKANTTAGTVPNENYARELMQLFTLGLDELNMDGSQVTANGVPVPTVTPAIVTQMSHVLTGWTYPTAPGATAKNNNPAYYFGQMFAVEAEHDTTAKTIFGNVTIPAGQTAEQDLESLLDAFMAQPTLAPFVSRQLIEHLVTSNPSPAYIQRISSVFENDGSGVTGNLQAVISAILLDPEARAGDDPNMQQAAYFGHMREPALFMANVLRGLGATLATTNSVAGDASNMGQNLFNSASVFSYFSPLSRTQFGLYGPEFQIYSTQTAADRVNVVDSLVYGKPSGITVNLQPFVAAANSTAGLVDYVNAIFMHGAMSTTLENALTAAINAQSTATAKAQMALYLVLTSSEYQIVQ